MVDLHNHNQNKEKRNVSRTNWPLNLDDGCSHCGGGGHGYSGPRPELGVLDGCGGLRLRRRPHRQEIHRCLRPGTRWKRRLRWVQRQRQLKHLQDRGRERVAGWVRRRHTQPQHHQVPCLRRRYRFRHLQPMGTCSVTGVTAWISLINNLLRHTFTRHGEAPP